MTSDNETRRFYTTSEFWITVGTVVATIAGVFTSNDRVKGIMVVASTIAYTIARGLAKQGVPNA